MSLFKRLINIIFGLKESQSVAGCHVWTCSLASYHSALLEYCLLIRRRKKEKEYCLSFFFFDQQDFESDLSILPFWTSLNPGKQMLTNSVRVTVKLNITKNIKY